MIDRRKLRNRAAKIKYLALGVTLSIAAYSCRTMKNKTAQPVQKETLASFAPALAVKSDSLLEAKLLDKLAARAAKSVKSDMRFQQDTGFIRGTQHEEKEIAGIVARLAKAPEGRFLIANAKKWETSIAYDSLMQGASGSYTAYHNHVRLNPDYSAAKLVSTLAHELTHNCQAKTGTLTTRKMSFEEGMIARRFYEADASSHAVLAAWQLRERGDSAVFDIFKESHNYGPMCRSVEGRAGVSEMPLTDKQVLQAAFTAWFVKDGPRNHYDKVSILDHASTILKGSDETLEKRYDDRIDLSGMVRKMCVTKEGECYLPSVNMYLNDKNLFGGNFDPNKQPYIDFLARRLDGRLSDDQTGANQLAEASVEMKQEKMARIVDRKNRYQADSAQKSKKAKHLPRRFVRQGR